MIGARIVHDGVSDTASVPLYEDEAARDEAYRTSQRERRPYLAVEHVDRGYTVIYDLLPAGAELAPPAHAEVRERLQRAVEAIVGDDAYPTTEVSQSVGPSLGNVGPFRREAGARETADVLAQLVLPEENWVEADELAGPSADDLRRN